MNGNIKMKEEQAASSGSYDTKVQSLLDQCRISQKLLNYIENFNYPYVSEVSYYEQLLKIGQGTFGEVFKARCKRTGKLVALKKILMENEKEGFPITALREIKMLQKLRHPHITELIEVCTSKQKSSKERFCFYLVFTFCEHDLAGLLSNNQVKIRLIDIKTMMQHILRGLYKIHASNILHRDMKAANVLITADGVLKLADFGLARLMYKQPEYCYTNRVVTLWYRPPELLLGTRHYGPAIDVWGAGCIMAELWIRAPILQGNTEQAQLELISKLCGSINPQSWPGCEKLPYYANLQAALPQNLPRRVRERINPFLQRWVNSFHIDDFAHYLASLTTQNNEQALALIDVMLTLNPEKRPDASAALDHNFFFEMPRPVENIQELLLQLKGTNLFEYTSGCGAHANRRRPVAPAAPMHHNNAAGNQSQQQMRGKMAPGGTQKGTAPQQQRGQHPGQQQQSAGPKNERQQQMQQPHAGNQGKIPTGSGAMPPPNMRKRPAQPLASTEQPSSSRRPPPAPAAASGSTFPQHPPRQQQSTSTALAGSTGNFWQPRPQQQQQSTSSAEYFASPQALLPAANQWGDQQNILNPHQLQQQMTTLAGGAGGGALQQHGRIIQRMPPPQQLMVRQGIGPSHPANYMNVLPQQQQQQHYAAQRQIPRHQKPSSQNPRHPHPQYFNPNY